MKIATATLVVLAAAIAQPAPIDPVVSPAWLAANLNDPNLVVLHVGAAQEYARAHIPGARYVSLAALHAGSGHEPSTGSGQAERELTLEMLPPDSLRRALEGLGIGDDSRVVVYFSGNRVTPATRLLFTLDWAGLGDRAALLDGGLPAWTAAGHATTGPSASSGQAAAPAVRRGRLSALRPRRVVVDASWVRTRREANAVRVVDARAREFYDGSAGHERLRGHVAGAVSLPYTEVLDDRSRLLGRDALRERFRAAGVAPGDTVVTYCHIGQQATTVLLAARLLGHPVRLYDGSFEDWARRGFPVEQRSR